MVLIVVLVVVVALSLAACTFAEWMFTERSAAHVAGRQARARVLAESGVEAVCQILSCDPQTASEMGGWYDNPDLFRGVLVVDDSLSRDRGRFTVLSPTIDPNPYGQMRYGLQNESAKLNLNTLLYIEQKDPDAGKSLLMALPGMTEDVADAILDWLDDDDEPRPGGAEVEYYSTLNPPYTPKNGRLQTIDELLMVRGVTPELLLGVDRNRNGYADDTEPDVAAVEGLDPSLESMDRGWSAYLTLYSLESDLQPNGQPKINVNQEDLEALNEQLLEVLQPDWATFILAFRQQEQQAQAGSGSPGTPGPSPDPNASENPNPNPNPSPSPGPSPNPNPDANQNADNGSRELDLTKPGNTKLATLLDLVDAKIQVKYKTQTAAVAVDNPFQSANLRQYLPQLMDVLTVEEETVIPGRININEAPAALLAAIPGMPEDAVDAILSRRQADPTGGDLDFHHATWLLTEAIVNLEQMKKLLPVVTGGGSVYRAQVIGFFDRDGPAARLEAVFNTTKLPARVVSWRELTPLGRGYPLEVLGAQPTDE